MLRFLGVYHGFADRGFADWSGFRGFYCWIL